MRHFSRGFTLIELLVVVALIGILSAIGIVSYSGYSKAAKIKQAEISLKSIYLAQQEYRSNNGEYCTNDCNDQNKIISQLFDDVDDLSEQEFTFKVNNKSDGFEIEAKADTGNCIIKLDDKNSLTKPLC